MTDREKQIEGTTRILCQCDLCDKEDEFVKYHRYCTCEDWNKNYALSETLYNAGYRKMDEVTLRLDLGDRSAEEVKQIAEAFNGDIKKQVAKEIVTAISNEAGVLRQTFNPERASVLEMLVLQLKKEFEVK